MPKTKQKIKHLLTGFIQNHPQLAIFGIIMITIIYTVIFLVIIMGISKITGLKYRDEAVGGVGSSLLILGIVWLAIKNENHWPFSQNNKTRLKINVFFSLLAIILLILLFIKI